jgi:hypothetical protein
MKIRSRISRCQSHKYLRTRHVMYFFVSYLFLLSYYYKTSGWKLEWNWTVGKMYVSKSQLLLVCDLVVILAVIFNFVKNASIHLILSIISSYSCYWELEY